MHLGGKRLTATAGFVAAAALLLGHAAVFVLFRHRFDYAFELIDVPSVALSLGLVLAGAVVLVLPSLIALSAAETPRRRHHLLLFVIVVGALLRLSMLLVNPALEDDYHRYLWDGAVTAHGLNPFAVAPGDAAGEPEGSTLARLAEEAGVVLDRVNHPDTRTIYPPVSQAAFALAYLMKPWSITAWRLVCLAGEATTLLLLLALLREVGRAPLWVALYWWNPIPIKELINSAHMEAILMPLVLAALWLAVRRRHLAANAMLGLAIGAKLWPVLLAPLLLRPLLAVPRRLLAALGLLSALCIAWLLPPLTAGLDETSGFVAYAQYWKTNSALFPLLETAVGRLIAPFSANELLAGSLVRAGSALAVGALALWLARTPPSAPEDLLRRATFVVSALFLLSPAQFPWYAVWVLPLAVFFPWRWLLVLAATLPIYYASFYFHARDTYDVFRIWVVWLIWLPVWAAMIADVRDVVRAAGGGRRNA